MVLIIFDILFIGAFITVAILRNPKRHGSSAPCAKSQRVNQHISGKVNCSLPWRTLVLAIVSALLHAATVAFHAAKDLRSKMRNDRVVDKDMHHNHNSLDSSPDAQGRYAGNRV